MVETKKNIAYQNDKKEGLMEYLQFLDNSFISDCDYSLSASLAHLALYSDHNLTTDILMYPSVQTRYKGVNMAIHPNFVENNMKITRFYITELNNYNPENGMINVSFTKYADIEKNYINWSNIFPEDKKWNNFIKEDFGHYMNSDFNSTFELDKKKIK